MKRYAAIFGASLRTAFSSVSAYRVNFIMSILITFFSNVLFPLVTILIYRSGAAFPGWTFHEVLLIQAIYTISSGLSSVFFMGLFWSTNFSVREGTFELALLKPVDTIFWLLVSSINLESAGMLIGGLVMTVVALSGLGSINTSSILACLLLFSGGIAVMLGVTLVMAATSFKWVGNSRIPEMFDSALQFARYPLDVFPRAARIAAAMVIPVAMVGFFPASALIRGAKPVHFLYLLPCLVFFWLGRSLYRAMIKYYEGVGG